MKLQREMQSTQGTKPLPIRASNSWHPSGKQEHSPGTHSGERLLTVLRLHPPGLQIHSPLEASALNISPRHQQQNPQRDTEFPP